MKRIAIIFVLSLVAFLANAQAYQPMVSRALLDKRITEVNSNIDARAAMLKTALDKVRTTLLSNTTDVAKWDLKPSARQTLDVCRAELGIDMASVETTDGLYIPNAYDKKLVSFLAWDKVERNPSVFSNKVTNIVCWRTRMTSGGTTNETYALELPGGARFVQVGAVSGNELAKLTCTTNSSQSIYVKRHPLCDDAWNIILGQ